MPFFQFYQLRVIMYMLINITNIQSINQPIKAINKTLRPLQ